MLNIKQVKELFPLDKVEIYHKDLGYSIDIENVPTIIENCTITHFSIIDGVVIAYARG